MFFFICARINGWVNNPEADDLRRHSAHFDVIVMLSSAWCRLRTRTTADLLSIWLLRTNVREIEIQTNYTSHSSAPDVWPQQKLFLIFLASSARFVENVKGSFTEALRYMYASVNFVIIDSDDETITRIYAGLLSIVTLTNKWHWKLNRIMLIFYFRETHLNMSFVQVRKFSTGFRVLPHWGRVMHICVSKLTIFGSDNGLSPTRQTII